jgi:hypothetical protein
MLHTARVVRRARSDFWINLPNSLAVSRIPAGGGVLFFFAVGVVDISLRGDAVRKVVENPDVAGSGAGADHEPIEGHAVIGGAGGFVLGAGPIVGVGVVAHKIGVIRARRFDQSMLGYTAAAAKGILGKTCDVRRRRGQAAENAFGKGFHIIAGGKIVAIQKVHIQRFGKRFHIAEGAGHFGAQLRVEKIRYGDSGENPDDRHNNQQFDQREGAFHFGSLGERHSIDFIIAENRRDFINNRTKQSYKK